MTKLSTLWTNSIAYVALATGAGLSIMYNVVDTIQVRGPLFDVYDLITAVAAPGIVVLMVEMFVSRWWIGRPWYMQVVRATSCSVIGGIAMDASWTHGHDFMASRGQTPDVAIMWPLAIDLLAIMATALILAGRRGHVAMAMDGHERGHGHMDQMATVAMATKDGQSVAMATDFVATPDGHPVAVATEPVATPDGHPVVATPEDLSHLDSLSVSEEAARYLREMAAPLPARRPTPVATGIPEEARKALLDWDGVNPPAKELDAALAAQFGRSERTARRWRTIVLGPTSSPPAS